MLRIQTYSDGQLVFPAELDSMQDAAAPAAGALGHMMGGFHAYSLDNATIAITAVNALVMGTAAAASGLVGVSGSVAITPSGLTTLAVNTWYYVYAVVSAGAITYEVSTQGPDFTGLFKGPGGGPDFSRRYICPFHTYLASPSIRDFNYTRGRYLYRFTAMGTGEVNFTSCAFNLLQDTATSGSGTALLTDIVTPAAKLALLRAKIKAGDGTHLGSMSLRPTGDPSGGGFGVSEIFQAVPVSAADEREFYRDLAIGVGGGHPAIDYTWTSASSAVTGNILLYGFVE